MTMSWLRKGAVWMLTMAAAIGIAHRAAAQSSTATPPFDFSRFAPTPSDTFETFHVKETIPLREALASGRLGEDTRLLITETTAGRLALVTDQMAFHDLAQGEAGGRPWMVSF